MEAFEIFSIKYRRTIFRLTLVFLAVIALILLLNKTGIIALLPNTSWGSIKVIIFSLALLCTLVFFELYKNWVLENLVKKIFIALIVFALFVALPFSSSLQEAQHVVQALCLNLIAFFIYLLFSLSRWNPTKQAIDKDRAAEMKRGYYIVALAIIVLLGLLLRSWNLDYLQGTDNFNILSAKALFENGKFYYDGNIQVTYMVALCFKIFGVSLWAARLPMVLFGTISVVLIFFLGSYLHKNIGLISAFLLAISPVAIEKSSFVRDYSEGMLWSIAASLILLKIYNKYRARPKKFILYYVMAFLAETVVIYSYSYFFHAVGVKAVLAVVLFISVPIFYFFVQRNYQKFAKYYVMIVLVGIIFSLAFVNYPLTLFSKGVHFQQYWIDMFFNPMVSSPMQWFSYSHAPVFFLAAVFLSSLFMAHRKEEAQILYFLFFSILSFFVLKYDPNLYHHSRYLYFILPFYVVIFSAGIYYFLNIARQYLKPKLVLPLLCIFLFVYVIIPSNSLLAAKHSLSIWNGQSSRQPTAAGSGDYYLNIIMFLKEQGLDNTYPVAIQGEDQFFISWFFGYTPNRNFITKDSNGEEQHYDVGQDLYIIDPYDGVNELNRAFRKRDEGFLIGHSSDYEEKDFAYENYRLSYLGKVEGYKVYRWHKIINNTSLPL